MTTTQASVEEGETGAAARFEANQPSVQTPAAAAGVDLVAATAAAEAFLTALGVSTGDDNLRDTPARMAKAWAEMLTPRPFTLTTFANDGEYTDLVMVRDIPFQSVCEHHLLPFVGVAHVGYLPGERIVGLSKLARVVEKFSHQPQTQERLTTQISRWLHEQLGARGVGVVMKAEHSCMSLRGVKTPGACTTTKHLTGDLGCDPQAREEFLAETR